MSGNIMLYRYIPLPVILLYNRHMLPNKPIDLDPNNTLSSNISLMPEYAPVILHQYSPVDGIE